MSTIITDNPYTFTVADNMNINAVFENNTATIHVCNWCPCGTDSFSSSDTRPIITGTGTYNIGDTCTLTYTCANSYSRFEFLAWADFENKTILSTNSTYSFTVSGDKTIYVINRGGGSLDATYSGYTFGPYPLSTYPRDAKATVHYIDGTSQNISFYQSSSSSSASVSTLNKKIFYIDYVEPTNTKTTCSKLYSLFTDFSKHKISKLKSSFLDLQFNIYIPPYSVVPDGPASYGWNKVSGANSSGGYTTYGIKIYFNSPYPPEFQSKYPNRTATFFIPYDYKDNYTDDWKARNFVNPSGITFFTDSSAYNNVIYQ